MIALPLALALALSLPGTRSDCSDLSQSPTLADQFTCYKAAGRRVSIPGTEFVEGGINGPGCIVGVAADRMQISSCSGTSFDRVTMLVPFASIRAVQDDPRQAYVTVVFPVAVIENDDCRTIDCSFGARSPRRLTTPTTSPTRPRLIAAPPR